MKLRQMQNNHNSMYKIYSRYRINLLRPKRNRSLRYKQRRYNFFALLITIALCYAIYFVLAKSIDQVFDTICSDKAKSVATIITNEQKVKAMENHDYNEMFTLTKDEKRKY